MLELDKDSFLIENHGKFNCRANDRKRPNRKSVGILDHSNENPKEMQQAGWQGFLNNFKKYVENN